MEKITEVEVKEFQEPALTLPIIEFWKLIEETKPKLIYKATKIGEVSERGAWRKIPKTQFMITKDGVVIASEKLDVHKWGEIGSTVTEMKEKGFSNYEVFIEANWKGEFESQEKYLKFISNWQNEGATYDEYTRARTGGFLNYKDYETAQDYNIDSYSEFKEFWDSGFQKENVRNVPRDEAYQNFIKAKEKGFLKKDDWDRAHALGIEDPGMYKEFTDGLEEEDVKNINAYEGWRRNQAKKLYEQFFEYKKTAFTNFREYLEAKPLGFTNPARYLEFKESGAKTKEEWEAFKFELPKAKEKYKEAKNDALAKFKKKNHTEFFRLRWISLEKLVIQKYIEKFKGIPPENNVLENSINSIIGGGKIDENEVTYWRRIRNKVIHENLKIKAQDGEKAKEFFDEMEKILLV